MPGGTGDPGSRRRETMMARKPWAALLEDGSI
jgi:hypothetical protein